jgi:hypothetical protein
MKNLAHKIWNNPKWFSITVVILAVFIGGVFVVVVANGLSDVAKQQETIKDTTTQPKSLESSEIKPQDATETPQTTKPTNQPSVKQTTPQSAPQQPTVQPTPKSCPAGTYNIGTTNEPVCKNEPTGCPYGDSIPVDSPKCAPPKGGY